MFLHYLPISKLPEALLATATQRWAILSLRIFDLYDENVYQYKIR